MSARVVHQVSARCLDYPSETSFARYGELRALVDRMVAGRQRKRLLGILDYLGSATPRQAQLHYVETFDLSRKRALYLSYWTDGDTRRRGDVLASIKQRYRASGWWVDTHGELPDYLPMVLEFAGLVDPADGIRLLQDYRPSLELLRLALVEAESPYAAVLEAVCATLPGASPADRAAVYRMAAAGPPREDVGLDSADPRLLPLAEQAGRQR